MIPTIPTRVTPDWLARLSRADIEHGEFPLAILLEHSAYCAGMGLAGTPVEILGGNVDSFVYVDHRVSRVEAIDAIAGQRHGFRGYSAVAHADVTGPVDQLLLSPRLTEHGIELNASESANWEIEFVKRAREPVSRWVVFERNPGLSAHHGPDRFSVVVISEDPVRVYLSLYRARNSRPDVFCVDGFAGNWTNLHDPVAALGQAVRFNPAGLPRFLALFDRGSGQLIRLGPDAWQYRDERFLATDHRAGVWARIGSDVGPEVSRDPESPRADR